MIAKGSIVAFDVDETLKMLNGARNGPVPLDFLLALRRNGIITGIAGNWPRFLLEVRNWYDYVSFVGPEVRISPYHKSIFLKAIKASITAPNYVIVGNNPRDPKWKNYQHNLSDEFLAAKLAGWRYVEEVDWQSLA